MSGALDRYREADRRYLAVAREHGEDSIRAEEIMSELSSLWWELTEEEQKMIDRDSERVERPKPDVDLVIKMLPDDQGNRRAIFTHRGFPPLPVPVKILNTLHANGRLRPGVLLRLDVDAESGEWRAEPVFIPVEG